MDYLKIIELISTILIMIGVPLISIPKILGLYLMIFGQLGWIAYSYLKGDQLFFLIQSIFLLIFNFIGIYNWKKKRVGC